MNPRQVDELTEDEYVTMVEYLEADAREQRRAAARAQRRRGGV
jgi:hypothetical protein